MPCKLSSDWLFGDGDKISQRVLGIDAILF